MFGVVVSTVKFLSNAMLKVHGGGVSDGSEIIQICKLHEITLISLRTTAYKVEKLTHNPLDKLDPNLESSILNVVIGFKPKP